MAWRRTRCGQLVQDAHIGDYHKVFTWENFARWFKHTLISNLSAKTVSNIDNTKYNIMKLPDTLIPRKNLKIEVHQYLTAVGMTWNENESAKELKEKAKQNQHENVPWKSCRWLNCKVIEFCSLPRHSDLQLIELIWAIGKGNVGRNHFQRGLRNSRIWTHEGQNDIENISCSVEATIENYRRR